jgi:hypothetical protein
VTTQATVSYTVNFARPPRTEAAPVRAVRVLRVARLLAVAHQIEAKVRSGGYRDLADAARKLSLTRARVTQVVNLTLLAPQIQEAILGWPPITAGREPITERDLRTVVAEVVWARQQQRWLAKKNGRGRRQRDAASGSGAS